MTTMELSDDEVEILKIIRQIDPSERSTVREFLERVAARNQNQVPAEVGRMRSRLPAGMPGREFVALIKQMDFSPQDLAEMEAAMEELGRVNLDEWDLSS